MHTPGRPRRTARAWPRRRCRRPAAATLRWSTRRDGHGDDQPPGTTLAHRVDGGAHRRAGGQAVVDQHDGAVLDVEAVAVRRGTPAPGGRARALRLDRRRRSCASGIASPLTTRRVDDHRAARGDGPHGELFVTGHAELADDEDVEFGARARRRPRRRPEHRRGGGRERSRSSSPADAGRSPSANARPAAAPVGETARHSVPLSRAGRAPRPRCARRAAGS